MFILSYDAISLLQDLLRYDPNQRPSASQALQHPFFNQNTLKISSSPTADLSLQGNSIAVANSANSNDQHLCIFGEGSPNGNIQEAFGEKEGKNNHSNKIEQNCTDEYNPNYDNNNNDKSQNSNNISSEVDDLLSSLSMSINGNSLESQKLLDEEEEKKKLDLKENLISNKSTNLPSASQRSHHKNSSSVFNEQNFTEKSEREARYIQ